MSHSISSQQDQYLLEILSQGLHWNKLLKQWSQYPSTSVVSRVSQSQGVIVGIGEGSSFFALSLAQPWLMQWIGQPCLIFKPLDYAGMGSLPFPIPDCLLVSQSGETGSLLHLIDPPGFLPDTTTWGITNHSDSSLSKHVDYVLHLGLPIEQSIPATMTMTVSWLTILFWASIRCQSIRNEPWSLLSNALSHTSHWLNRELSDSVLAFVQTLGELKPYVLLGQMPMHAALPEIALKLMETTGQLAIADRIENFQHGPKASLSQHPQVFIWIDQLDAVEKVEQVRNAFPTLSVALITLGMNSAIKGLGVPVLMLPKALNTIDALLMTLASGQLLSWAVCVHHGLSPNHPQLTKQIR